MLKEEEQYIKDSIEELKEQIGSMKDIKMTEQEIKKHEEAKFCHICSCPLDKDNKVRDHCHITGQYRGAAHNSCNLHFKFNNEIPIFFHNLRGYDSHLIMQEIDESIKKIKCIPNNMEKYMSFSLDNLTFKDSMQFLNSSLDKLAKNLKEYKHIYELAGNDEQKLALLTRKGVYPYDYMDSFEKFNDNELPPQLAFYSILNDEHISDEDYEHAQNVWNTFDLKSMGDYHDLYLATDVLLLADVFENFRDTCLKSYKLDPVHYYSSPGLAWDAALKMTKVKLELLTDPDMHLMVEDGKRGGISMITNRYSKANNKYMASYDESKPSKYIIYLDANNLYGWAMCQSLPTGNFKWIENPEEFDYININSDSDKGYMLEVDLHYPEDLNDLHSDYPLAPERLKVTKSMLSDYQLKLMSKHNIKESNVYKLVPNLRDKTKYVVHYRNLQLYESLGLKVTKIHRVLEFSQSPWLKKYIMFNTRMRMNAQNDFEKDFFKLMNNSVFGKTMENLRNRVDVELVNTPERRKKVVAKPNFNSMKIFNENLAAINKKKVSLVLNKPIYCGVTILDNSKQLMYDFHYKYIKSKYGENAKLLFTDTDSLCYEIKTDDIYQDIYNDKPLFDLSDYPKDSPFYDAENKKVIGKFKDETAMKPIVEFVGLRAKMYSIKTEDNKESKKAKGIKKNVVKKNITHNNYVDTLANSSKTHTLMHTIRSDHHTIKSYRLNKVGLSCFDDKRYILDDGIDTLAHGHHKIV